MNNLFNPPKFANGSLVGCDGNAFALMAHFNRCARKSGWNKEDIDCVLEKAKESDYDNLVCTLDCHMQEEE